MENKKQPRLTLMAASVLVVFFSAIFVLVVSKANSAEMIVLLAAVGIFYIATMCLYGWKGEIYEDDGSFRTEVYIVLMAVPILFQLMFGFLHFAYQEIDLRHMGYGTGTPQYTRAISEVMAEILTSAAISMLFTAELVFFTMQKIKPKNQAESPMLRYVRQIAFIFFFANSLSSSFIPVMAKNLVGEGDSFLISLPQTATFLCTCVAIVVFPQMASLRGVRFPFTVGVTVYVLGVAAGIFSGSILVFTVSRGIVGIGYGLCWMSLRGLSTLPDSEGTRNKYFSELNAGIYAGIICGGVFGSILIQNFESTTLVFLTAIAISAAVFIFVSRMPVTRLSLNARNDANALVKPAHRVFLAVFVLIMIFPSCLVESFLGYYFPLWVNGNHHKFTDVGRAQLIYGISIVHIGPLLARHLKMDSRGSASGLNIIYNTLLGASLLVFFFIPGAVTGIAVCSVIGLADSFGFTAQNSLFFNTKVSQKLGRARAMSLLSFSKKLSASFGPFIFGLAFSFENGLMLLGAAIVVLALLFMSFRKRGFV